MAKFGGGQPNAGRPKGIPNKLNSDIKEMIVGALCAVGGTNYLARQAEQNPVAFMGLIGRVLPLQLAGHDGQKLVVDFRWADAPQPLTIDAVATETTDATDTVADETTVTFLGEC